MHDVYPARNAPPCGPYRRPLHRLDETLLRDTAIPEVDRVFSQVDVVIKKVAG